MSHRAKCSFCGSLGNYMHQVDARNAEAIHLATAHPDPAVKGARYANTNRTAGGRDAAKPFRIRKRNR
jgi:hypothetical protein